jgi:hypothetical protein
MGSTTADKSVGYTGPLHVIIIGAGEYSFIKIQAGPCYGKTPGAGKTLSANTRC